MFHSTLWEQAAAQGITVLMASGDTGSAVCDRDDPDFGMFAAQYGLVGQRLRFHALQRGGGGNGL